MRKPRAYVSRVAFRVTESELEAATTPRTNGRLRDYVATVVFSNAHLLAVIKEHELYPALMARDPSLAVEAMRDDIDVEVWRNYFAQTRSTDDPARSARLAVTVHGNNAQKVYDTVHALGPAGPRVGAGLAPDAGRAGAAAGRRSGRAVAPAPRLAQARAGREDDRARTGALARARRCSSSSSSATSTRRCRARRSSSSRQEKRREQAYLRTQLEKHALGLRWELIDPGRIEAAGMSRRTLLRRPRRDRLCCWRCRCAASPSAPSTRASTTSTTCAASACRRSAPFVASPATTAARCSTRLVRRRRPVATERC